MVSTAWAGGVREGRKRQDGLGEGEEGGGLANGARWRVEGGGVRRPGEMGLTREP